MQRKEFTITSDAGHHAIKYAWNASCRRIEDMARKLAKADGTTYNLTHAESHKDTYGVFYRGTRVWTGDNGKIVTFNIERTK